MSHAFAFEGDTKLSSIAASWFVSYAYYLKVDKGHKVWENVSSAKQRMKVFNGPLKLHYVEFLKEVLKMNDKKLNTSHLKLGSSVIKQMALDLLKKEGF